MKLNLERARFCRKRHKLGALLLSVKPQDFASRF